jgi:DMSO/TMAO reductase YedYZ molybdopterin-dependent catalytic subunit
LASVVEGVSAERVLARMSDFTDRVQAWLFDPRRLARHYPECAITRPFPFNAFYPEGQSPEVDPDSYRLELAGSVEDRTPWTFDRLHAPPRVTQVTRHICIEGWSAIGKWSGARFSEFLARIGADTSARYVTFRCEDGYTTSIDMATALHPRTQLTFWFDDALLPAKYGFPMKLRVPTKLGFKNPKHVAEIGVGNEYTGGYWETYGYNWFSGL